MKQIYQLLSNYKKAQWLIFSLACIIYVNTIPNKWAVDDSLIIFENSFVKRGAAGLDDILSKDAFAGFYGENINAVPGGRYRPLTPALFAMQAELFASNKKDIHQKIEKDNEGYKIKDLGEDTLFPNILHFFNVLWYGLLCLVIYRTILLLIQSKKGYNEDKTNFIALVTCLIFTVHPIHTEAVANVKGLDEILALLGAFLSLFCVLKVYHLPSDKTNTIQKTKWIALSVVFYSLALLSKESAITFIAIIPLALWTFSEATTRSIFKLTLPLLIALLGFLGIRTTVLYEPNKGVIAKELMNDPFLVLDENAQFEPLVAGSGIRKMVNPSIDSYSHMPTGNKLATNVFTYWKYIKLLFVPYPLTVDYYPRHIEIKSFADFTVMFSLILHISLLIWAVRRIKSKNPIAFGILYYFITFSIVSNLFFQIGTNMAERFMFMPSFGFCFILAYLLYAIGDKLSQPNTNNGFLKVYDAIAVIGVIFSIVTINRNFDWKDNFTLFSKDILVSKNSGKIQADLGGYYILKAGEVLSENQEETENLSLSEKSEALARAKQENMELLKKATPLLTKAIEIHPMNYLAWFHLANAELKLGQINLVNPKENLNYLTTALAAFEQADIYKPTLAKKDLIKGLRGLCLRELGKLHGEKFGDIEKAISYLEQAKQMTPKDPEIFLLLGTAYSLKSEYEKSIEYTQESLVLRPEDRDTKQNLAIAYQIYAAADSSKAYLLSNAEQLLLEIYQEEKKLADNDVTKINSIIRTLDLLYKNYAAQGNSVKQNEYRAEILKYNPNAFANQ